MAMGPGMKGCGGCHEIGLEEEAQVAKLETWCSLFGHASCDACHARHTFSVVEARQPQACRTCPMAGSDHEIRPPRDLLAVRLPLPRTRSGGRTRFTVLRALGVLDPEGDPTARPEVVKAADVARLTQEAFDEGRDEMISVCGDCHSENFARGELAKGDEMIREADHLLAEAIRIIAGLSEDGLLKTPEGQPYTFPDPLTNHDAPSRACVRRGPSGRARGRAEARRHALVEAVRHEGATRDA